MKYRQKIKIISFVLIILGAVVWLFPYIFSLFDSGNDFEVKNIKLTYQDKNIEIVDEVKLYIPEGKGPFPGIVLGSGAGADKALYRKWGKGFVKENFVVLLRSKSYGRKENKMWIDSREDTINALNYLKSLKIVDSEKVLVGGHSGSAKKTFRQKFRS